LINQFISRLNLFRASQRFSRKLLVIESDDWGSIRVKSKVHRDKLLKIEDNSAENVYNIYDSLENKSDFEFIDHSFENFERRYGKRPIITANTIVGNPDFEKIAKANYSEYFWESISDTYHNYYGENLLSKYYELIEKKTFYPQFHGREHVNVQQWLKLLKLKSSSFHKAFDLESFAIDNKNMILGRNNLMASWDVENISCIDFINKSIKEGLLEFEKLFGFKSKTAIAPAAVWGMANETELRANSVEYLQGFVIQNNLHIENKKKMFHYMGESSINEIKYIIRNVVFEPSNNQDYDWVNNALQRIGYLFFLGLPVVISMHRINFISNLSEENRNVSIHKLMNLLSLITEKWPDVEFVDSETLSKYFE
jgi:hypothetical protein